MKATSLLKKINSALLVLEDARQYLQAQIDNQPVASRATKAVVKTATKKAASKLPAKKRVISAEGRKRIAEAQNKRWAAAKKATKTRTK